MIFKGIFTMKKGLYIAIAFALSLVLLSSCFQSSLKTLIDETYNIEAFSNNSYSFSLNSNSKKVNISIEVLNGNRLNFYLINNESEFRHYQKAEPFECISGTKSLNMFEYSWSGSLNAGKYYICIQDPTLGIFSSSTSNIKINVTAESSSILDFLPINIK